METMTETQQFLFIGIMLAVLVVVAYCPPIAQLAARFRHWRKKHHLPLSR